MNLHAPLWRAYFSTLSRSIGQNIVFRHVSTFPRTLIFFLLILSLLFFLFSDCSHYISPKVGSLTCKLLRCSSRRASLEVWQEFTCPAHLQLKQVTKWPTPQFFQTRTCPVYCEVLDWRSSKFRASHIYSLRFTNHSWYHWHPLTNKKRSPMSPAQKISHISPLRNWYLVAF